MCQWDMQNFSFCNCWRDAETLTKCEQHLNCEFLERKHGEEYTKNYPVIKDENKIGKPSFCKPCYRKIVQDAMALKPNHVIIGTAGQGPFHEYWQKIEQQKSWNAPEWGLEAEEVEWLDVEIKGDGKA